MAYKYRSCFYDFGARSSLEFVGESSDDYDETMEKFMSRVKDFFDNQRSSEKATEA